MKKQIALGGSHYENRIGKSIELLKSIFSVVIEKYGFPKIAVMCGTSGPFTEDILVANENTRIVDQVSYESLNFPVPSVSGHEGKIYFVLIDSEIPVLICCGRVHYFEGHSMDEVVFSTRALACFGVEKFILTNAAGSLDPQKFSVGDIVEICDHVNCLGDSPMRGPQNIFKEFVDMTSSYSKSMHVQYGLICNEKYQTHKHIGKYGIYVATPGREFETPAEVKNKFSPLGDLIGMSTIPEVIAGRQLGCDIFAFSLVTNVAAGLSEEEVVHEENLRIVQTQASLFSEVIIELIKLTY